MRTVLVVPIRVARCVLSWLPGGRAFWVLVLLGGCFLFASPSQGNAQGPIPNPVTTITLLGDLVGYFVGTATESLLEDVFCALKKLVCWGVEFIADLALDLMEAYDESVGLPEFADHDGAWEDILDWLDWANAWLPLGWFVVFASLYTSWVVFVITIKWILKLIPTMG